MIDISGEEIEGSLNVTNIPKKNEKFKIKYTEIEENLFEVELLENYTDGRLDVDKVVLQITKSGLIVKIMRLEGDLSTSVKFQRSVSDFLESL